jgi:hypothetical protein
MTRIARRNSSAQRRLHPIAEEDQRPGTEPENLNVIIDHEYVAGRFRLASRW